MISYTKSYWKVKWRQDAATQVLTDGHQPIVKNLRSNRFFSFWTSLQVNRDWFSTFPCDLRVSRSIPWNTVSRSFRNGRHSVIIAKSQPRPQGQGWITCAHVRDLMACAGANGLGTITNLEKMAIEMPVHESSNGLVKLPQATLACSSSSCSLNKRQAHSLDFACEPKNNSGMDLIKIQVCPA